jgi:transcriptional regulator with XRE-family HTH domain
MITSKQLAEARRDLGRQLAIWRKAAGLTQAKFGPRIGYSRSAIGNVEIGREHSPRSFWQVADRELSAGGALLAAHLEFTELEERYKAQIARSRDQERAARIETLMQSDVLQPTATLGTTLAERPFDDLPGDLPGGLHPQWLMPDLIVAQDTYEGRDDMVTLAIMSDGQTQSLRMSRRALLELAASLATMPTASAVSVPVPPTVDPGVVEHFTALRALLVQADSKLGGLSILPTVQQQITLIARCRRQARGKLRTRLLGAEARWSEFSGWLSDDLGDRDAGGRWLDRAASMAQEADDQEFCAYVLARKAQRTTGTGDEDRVVGLARAAARVPGAPVLVRAFAAVQEAQGSALDGDAAAFEDAMERARSLVDAAPPAHLDDDTLGSFCTTPYLFAHEGEGWLRLNSPRQAIDSFRTAVNQWPERYRRERGLYLSRTAHAYLAASEPDQAATTATEALALATATGSARIRRDVTALSRQLKPFETRPAVRTLLDQMAGTL